MIGNNYYIPKKSEFFAQFEDFNKRIRVSISRYYGEKFADAVCGEITVEYETIFPKISFIGGDKNPLTFNLVSAEQNLAVYKVLKRQRKPLKGIGELCYKTEEEFFDKHPELIPPLTHPKYIGFMKHTAEGSQEKKYSGDWVYNYMESDGNFDYRLDFTH